MIESKSVYVAGPMSGIAEFNRPAFMVAESYLRDQGLRVMNPAVLPDGFSHEQYLSIALPMLRACEAVVFLPGWRESVGAMMEYDEAQRAMMPCFEMQMGAVYGLPYVIGWLAMPGVAA